LLFLSFWSLIAWIPFKKWNYILQHFTLCDSWKNAIQSGLDGREDTSINDCSILNHISAISLSFSHTDLSSSSDPAINFLRKTY